MKALNHYRSALLVAILMTACAGTPSKEPALAQTSPQLAPMPEKQASAKPSLSEAGLYIRPDQAFRVDQLKDALDNILAANPNVDNLIFYVHGRSCKGEGEPTKSFKEVMPLLESDYTAKSLMFYWPGSDDECPDGFPEGRAKAAAPAFAQVLSDLQQYKNDRAATVSNIKLTLILHSMGNNVFEAFLRSYKEKSLGPDLFDTIVLNSSATESRGHHEWLKKTDFSQHLYVTVNNHDGVLRGAGFRNLSARLGRSLETAGVRPVPLARNATYVDFTDTGVNHRYFISSGQEDNSYMRQFYDSVMNGKAFNFTGFKGIKKMKERDNTHIYYFRKG